MARIASVWVMLFSALFASARDGQITKPAMVGVMVAIGKDKSTIEVRMILDNSPAEKAGLKSGDLLVRINGIKPADLATAVRLIRALKPGKKAKFLIERDGKEKTIEILPMAADE